MLMIPVEYLSASPTISKADKYQFVSCEPPFVAADQQKTNTDSVQTCKVITYG